MTGYALHPEVFTDLDDIRGTAIASRVANFIFSDCIRGRVTRRECRHHTVRTLEARIRPSRLTTGTPKYIAVAATMRSGMSGMSLRGTKRMVSTTSPVNGASSRNKIGIVERSSQLVVGRYWEATSLRQVYDFGQADRREHDFITGPGSIIHETACGVGEARILEQVPKRGVGIRNLSNHGTSLANPLNISRRFSSISSSDGPAPYLASRP